MTIDSGALVHAAIAFPLVLTVSLVGDYFDLWYMKYLALGVNSAGWLLREAWQGYRAGRVDPFNFSAHRKREAFYPVAAGFMAVAAALRIN